MMSQKISEKSPKQMAEAVLKPLDNAVNRRADSKKDLIGRICAGTFGGITRIYGLLFFILVSVLSLSEENLSLNIKGENKNENRNRFTLFQK